MIPSDLAARLRLLGESVVQPVSPVRGIPGELPELPVGQRFVARIEGALPDGNFRAVVAGRSLTLALPEAAQAGDTLDLVVTGRTPQLIAAQRAEASASSPPLAIGQRFLAHIEAALPDGTYRARVAGNTLSLALPEPAQPGRTLELLVTGVSPRLISAQHADAAVGGRALLSPTGQLLGALLAGTGQPPQAPTVTRSGPLLPQPPAQAADLAQALKQTIAGSGLFYEAHQAQWIAGQYPVEALRREPQARLARPGVRAEGPPSPQPADAPAVEAGAGEAQARASAATAGGLAAELQTLVQQQLDAAATQQIVWRGEIWPGQELHWEIEAEAREGSEPAEAESTPWTTSLKLTLPHLGEINAVLRLDAAKASLAMTADAAHAGMLAQGLDALAAGFAAAGLPPLAAEVEAHG